MNWKDVKAFFAGLNLGGVFSKIGSVIKGSVEVIVGAFIMLKNKVSSVLGSTKGSFKGFGQFINAILDFLGRGFKVVFENILTIVATAVNAIGGYFSGLQKLFSGNFTGALQEFRDVWKTIFTGILNIATRFFKSIITSVAEFAGAFSSTVEKEIKGFAGSFDDNTISDALGLSKTQNEIDQTENSVKDFFAKAKKLGSLPSIGGMFSGGGTGGGTGGGDDDQQLSKVDDSEQTGPKMAKTVPDDALQNVKGFAALQRKAAEDSKKLNKQMQRQAERQRRNAVINQQAGQIIGRTMKRTTQQLTKTFSAALVGTKSLSKGMAAFGNFMQKMFQKLIQKVIQLIIKMTILKALQSAIGGGLGGGIGGGAIGGIVKGLGGGFGGMFGGGGSGGGGGSMNISGSLKGDDINLAGQRAQGNRNRINGAGID
jgi:large-conductance mechanosensitive channel